MNHALKHLHAHVEEHALRYFLQKIGARKSRQAMNQSNGQQGGRSPPDCGCILLIETLIRESSHKQRNKRGGRCCNNHCQHCPEKSCLVGQQQRQQSSYRFFFGCSHARFFLVYCRHSLKAVKKFGLVFYSLN